MPACKGEEKLSDFIARFVSSKGEMNKTPERKQRLSLGYQEAKEQARKEKRNAA